MSNEDKRKSLVERREKLSPEMRALLKQRLQGKSTVSPAVTSIPKRPSGTAALSYAQQRLWFLNQLEPDNPFYNESVAVRLSGPLNVALLEKSINILVARHEGLRTIFPVEDGSPIQKIAASRQCDLPIIDLAHLPTAAAQQAKIQQLAIGYARQAFDLAQGPLFHPILFQMGHNEHVFLILMHHIIADGWSIGIFVRELSMIYEGLHAGITYPLPNLPIQYADFAYWQRQQLQDAVLSQQMDYWKQQLANVPMLTLPTDKPRPSIQTFNGAKQLFILPPELSQSLRQLCQKEGVTPFMLLLAAFNVLLYRYTNQTDIAIGSPIANRNRHELENVIGFFVNTVVLRTMFSNTVHFRQLLKQVQEIVLHAYENQDLPFDKLVEALQPKRTTNQNPLFQVMFLFHDVLQTQSGPSGLTVSHMEFDHRIAKFDLTLFMRDEGSCLTGLIEYSADLFHEDTIARLGDHFQHLLASIVANPDLSIARFPLLDVTERQQIVTTWNATQTAFDEAHCIHHLFEAQVTKTPEAAALVFEDQSLTYRELNERANQIAHYLLELGVQMETPVGIYVERSLEMVAGILGIMKAGCAYVPLDVSYPSERLTSILAQSGAAILLTQESLRESIPAVYLGQTLYLDSNWTLIANGECDNPVVPVTPQHLAYIIFTSGSTGVPKGVSVAHLNLLNYLHSIQQRLGNSVGDQFATVSTLSADLGNTVIFPSLCSGGCLHIIAEDRIIDAEALAAYCRQHPIDYLKIVPSHLTALLATPDSASILPHKRLVLGGEASSWELVERIHALRPDCQILNHYGPTETTIGVLTYPVTETRPFTVTVPIGRPIDNVQIYLLDQHLHPVPIGVPGELYVGGRSVSRGYYQQPRLTAERFVPDPFATSSENGLAGGRLYRTGDLARYLSDGVIEFLGRVDRQIKIRGFRIELGEIEAVINQHQAVHDNAVIIREDTPDDRRLVAYVIPNPEHLQETAVSPSQDLVTEQVSQWQMVFEETYTEATTQGTGITNLTGWNSSYENAPINETEMMEWLDTTIQEILTLHPQDVLEIGCGAGLLLFRIAPHCHTYVGTDFSQEAIQYLEQTLAQLDPPLPQVSVQQQPAHDFVGLEAHHFDVIIINSVVQYFPSADYLQTVLENALHVLKPGGCIYIGDVRNLSLLPAFYASVEVHKAPASLSKAQLQQRINRQIQNEEELVIAPHFFRSLPQKFPQISQVTITPKQGQALNELTKFRYQVFIFTGTHQPTLQVNQWLNWSHDQMQIAHIQRLLSETHPQTLGILNVTNARLEAERSILTWLAKAEPGQTVSDLRSLLQRSTANGGGSPATFQEIGQALGYDVTIRWDRDNSDGTFDVVFGRFTEPPHQISLFPNGHSGVPESNHYTNNPLYGIFVRRLRPQLHDYIRERLPEHMVPAALIMIESFPLTPNGKLNHHALPMPEYQASTLSTTFIAPRTPIEEILAGVWAQVLGFERVGIHDNFFELGGHSLLATQLISRVRNAFQVNVPLRQLFERPTVAALAQAIETALQHTHGLDVPPIQSTAQSEDAPLSFSQQRFWFLDQLYPGNAAYHLYYYTRVTGPVQIGVLERCFNEMVRRHEILRTYFVTREEHPVQKVAAFTPQVIPQVDLRHLPTGEREAAIQQIAQEEASRPFNMTHGPLWRLQLVQADDEEFIFLFTLHHIISDGWSRGIMTREIMVLYEAFAADQSSPMPDLTIQYADFARWQQSWLRDQVLQKLVHYWIQKLAGAPLALDLPTDRPYSDKQTFHGASHRIQLSPQLTQALKALSQQEGATLYMTLLAVFNVLLCKYTRQQDILITSPIANRNRLEIEGLIGFFVNTLIFRTQLSGTMSFHDLLQQVRETALEAYTYQDIPFEKLVERLQPERDPARNPLAQVSFVYNTGLWPSVEVADLTLEPLDFHPQRVMFDLTLVMIEFPHDESLAGAFEYNTALFDEATIVRLAQHFQFLLETAVSDPHQPIATLSPLIESERQRLLLQARATAVPYPSNVCTHHLFTQQAVQTPDAIAATYEDETMTYANLEQRANQLAHYLHQLGAGPETLVALRMEPGFDLLVGVMGILKAGAAYLPLYLNDPAQRVAFIVADANVDILLTQETLAALAPDNIAHVVCIDSNWPEIARESAQPFSDQATPENLAYVIYTSGSTGRPKGTLVSHRNLVNYIHWVNTGVFYNEIGMIPFVTSVAFDASLKQFMAPLLRGDAVWIMSPQVIARPDILLTHIDKQPDASLNCVPSLWQAILDYLETQPTSAIPKNLTRLSLGGEAISKALVTRTFAMFPHLRFWNVYGPTETTSNATLGSIQAGEVVTIGRPIANACVYILDEYLTPVPIGVYGEIYIGGEGVARGYLQRPGLTAACFIPDPYSGQPGRRLYRSGDIARYLPNGNIEFAGRQDTQIKIRGYRLELGEIEATLAQAPGVQECAVLPRTIMGQGQTGNTELIAFTAVSTPDTVTSEQLRQFLADKLPAYMIPGFIITLDKLPLTPSGKIDRQRLLTWQTDVSHTSREFIAPRDMLEFQLAQVWEELLQVRPIGVRDDFFTHLGGHSLLTIRLLSRIQERFGANVPLFQLYQNSTIESQVKFLKMQNMAFEEQETAPLNTPLVAIQPHGTNPPFFCIHPLDGNVTCYIDLAAQLHPDQPFYGVQSPMLYQEQTTLTSIEEMAACYIKAIRTVQETGPYHLGGWSLGGLLAFEVARQFQDQGEAVDLLAIFDRSAPISANHTGAIDEAQLLQVLSEKLSDFLGQAVVIDPDAFIHLELEEQLTYLQTLLETAADYTPSSAELWQLKRFLLLQKPHLRASRQYKPANTYALPLTLFRASEREMSAETETLGWHELVTDSIQIHVVPGSHHTMIRPPYVSGLGEQLQACLDMTYQARKIA